MTTRSMYAYEQEADEGGLLKKLIDQFVTGPMSAEAVNAANVCVQEGAY